VTWNPFRNGGGDEVTHFPVHGDSAAQIAQVLLRMQYRQIRDSGARLPDLADVEFRCHSQNGEDGILLYIFSLIGTTSRKSVEICAGNGVECNTANLIINHGWQGLLVDGSQDNIDAAKAFYERHPNTRLSPPALAVSWVTAENVNGLISSRGFGGEIDLFSLDVDGVDYWIWRAIDCMQPRVVVLEFNGVLGPDERLTIPYDPAFKLDLAKLPHKCGASLSAFAALGRDKGYRLVGVQSLGINAFFVRAGVGEDVLPERSPGECFARVERLRAFHPGWVQLMYADGQRWQTV
jgi:hypothetical protein